MNAILIIDNGSAHKDLCGSDFAKEFGLPDTLTIIFLPPNLTSRIKPTDMGITEVLKIGYTVFMVNKLLDMYKYQSFADINLARNKHHLEAKIM